MRGRRFLYARKVEIDGIVFDSKSEGQRWLYLKDAESKGVISNLRRQVKYEIIPSQFEEQTIIKQLKTKTKVIKKMVCVERSMTYSADFVYEQNGKVVVEDVKASKDRRAVDPVYYIKRKLMLYVHHIKIKEVYTPSEEV